MLADIKARLVARKRNRMDIKHDNSNSKVVRHVSQKKWYARMRTNKGKGMYE